MGKRFSSLLKKDLFPQPLRSWEDFQKLNNTDLQGLSSGELRVELLKAEFALLFSDDREILCLLPSGELITFKDWAIKRLFAVGQMLNTG